MNECLQQAGDNADKQRKCTENDFLFSYQIQASGIPLKFKYYAYRWQAQYAPQMHEKLFIFDGKTVMTGSYNLSNNAEHETFENFVVLDGSKNASAAKAYEKNFESIWTTGAADDRVDAFAAADRRRRRLSDRVRSDGSRLAAGDGLEEQDPDVVPGRGFDGLPDDAPRAPQVRALTSTRGALCNAFGSV